MRSVLWCYLLSILLVSLQACAQSTPQVEQTQALPEQVNPTQTITPVVYESFESLEFLFQQQTDTTYVINFWATWCKPCVEELPYFEEANQKLSAEKVKIVLVSLDFPKQIEKKLIPFLQKHNLQSEVVVMTDGDANKWIPKIAEEWSGSIPATLVYKKDQRAFYEQSFHTYQELETIIKPFIKS